MFLSIIRHGDAVFRPRRSIRIADSAGKPHLLVPYRLHASPSSLRYLMPRVVLGTGFSIPEAVADRQGKVCGAAAKEESRRQMRGVNHAKISVSAVRRPDAATTRRLTLRRLKGQVLPTSADSRLRARAMRLVSGFGRASGFSSTIILDTVAACPLFRHRNL